MTASKTGKQQAAVYVRVSRVGQRDTDSASYGTEAEQEERCRAYAASKGYAVREVVSDIDASGGRWDRRGLDAVLAMAEAGQIDAVIVYRLSRLGRGLRGVLATVERLQAAGVALASVHEGIDLSTASGRMIFNVLASFDQYERELRGEYWDATKSRAHARGVLIGPTPFGYQRIKGGEDAGRLAVHPTEGPVVAEVFKARAEGATFAALADLIDARCPREDGKATSTTQAARIVRGRVYVGEVTHRGHVEQDAHPAIVTEREWRAAQDVRRRAPIRRSEARDFPLSGIARCAGCGTTMSGQARSGTNGTTAVYKCRRRSAAGTCSAPSVIVAGRLEAFVTDAVLDALREREARGVEDPASNVAALAEAAEQADSELAEFVADTSLRRVLGDADWRAGVEARAAARDAANAELEAARDALTGKVLRVPVAEVEHDPELLAAAVRGSVDRVLVRRGRGLAVADRVEIVWR